MALRKGRKNIFCLEGDWWGDLKKPSTVRPIFDLVGQMSPNPEYIHRGIGTREEFDHYLKIWSQQRFDDYPILYLAFHGDARSVFVGDQRRKGSAVALDDIAEKLRGRCRGRLVHFGACSTLRCDRRHLKRFLNATDALAVSGYTLDIGWMESAAFEVFLLDTMQCFAQTRAGARAMQDRVITAASKQAKELGFRMVIAGD